MFKMREKIASNAENRIDLRWLVQCRCCDKLKKITYFASKTPNKKFKVGSGHLKRLIAMNNLNVYLLLSQNVCFFSNLLPPMRHPSASRLPGTPLTNEG
jgi:hypothetical protein